MSTVYSVIADDFVDALVPLREIVKAGEEKSSPARVRVASVHAATLLLAATFEEFVRQMAREYAVQVVAKASRVSDLPDALSDTAWRRTFDKFARSRSAGRPKRESLEIFAKQARPAVDALCACVSACKIDPYSGVIGIQF